MQLSNTKNKTFEAKTKLQLSLVSIPNMEITTHWEKKTPIAKQTNKTHLLLYPFEENKTLTTIG